MDISTISRVASQYGAQTRGATASPEIMQAAAVKLIKQTTGIVEQTMDTLLAEIAQSVSHLGQNIDISI